MENRLIIVSNRLPIQFSKNEEGNLSYKESTGGLATGLKTFYKDKGGLWIGWPGVSIEEINSDDQKEITKTLEKEQCAPIFMSEELYDGYYLGFSNNTLWPLCHYFTQFAKYYDDFWESYKKANELFCDEVIKHVNENDFVWIQDYHLMLLPQMLREKLPNAKIGFFLHIPFPSSEVFRQLPWREEILNGLLGADLVGFHTYDYVRHFLESIRRIVGYEHTYGMIKTDQNFIRVDAFPISIDFEKYFHSSDMKEVQEEAKKFRKEAKEQKIIVTIDRLDYTKGIPQRLEAFDHFLKKYPEYQGKVTLVMISAPSRTDVETYQNLRRYVDELVGKINGKYGRIGWTPVIYFFRAQPFESVAAFYLLADAAMVTPIRDGMNLVAKEFIASRKHHKGALILSETAGAAQELSEAIQVNPNNSAQIADAIKEALEMPEEVQIENNRMMQERVKRYDINRWVSDFLDEFQQINQTQQNYYSKDLTLREEEKMIRNYKKSRKRLLLLDYDGTLIGFKNRPTDARPDGELLHILDRLSGNEDNTVYLISGRDKNTLSYWFDELNIGIIAEHGVWIKRNGEDWKTIFPINNEWKKEIKPIMEFFMDRTPGAILEEKDYSFVWHYRKVNPTLAHVRVNELKDVLVNFTENLSLGILDGNKIVEIKNLNINKGTAADMIIKNNKPDFILAVGDDLTDEDMFRILPEDAVSLRVGFTPTYADFNVKDSVSVRRMLNKLKDIE